MLKVIIVDDEIKVCKLIHALIDWNSLDMEVVGTAHNGIDALDLVKEYRPDIIITDIRMPGYDGLEFIMLSKEVNPQADFIIISGYKQFEYAQDAIKYGVSEYLLKPLKKSDLESTLVRISKKKAKVDVLVQENQEKFNKLRLGLYTDILFGDKKIKDIADINREYNYEFSPGCFQCFAIKVDCASVELFNSMINKLSEKIINIVKNCLKGEYYDMEFARKDSFIYCIVNYDKTKNNEIRRKIKQISDELNIYKSMFEKIDFTIGLKEPTEELSEDSLQKTELLVMQRIVSGTGKIIVDLPTETQNDKPELLAGFEEQIERTIEILDWDELYKTVVEFKKTIAETTLSGQSIFNLVCGAYGIYLSKLKKYQFITKDIVPDVFEFSLCGSLDRLFAVLEAKMKDSTISIIEAKKLESIKPIRIAKQFINDNYMNTITLEDISTMVNFNPSYFSALFKKETGENFLEYISRVRINKAKELLKETDLNITAICERVGYQDIAHFTRYFKKYTGIKPNAYRKLYF